MLSLSSTCRTLIAVLGAQRTATRRAIVFARARRHLRPHLPSCHATFARFSCGVPGVLCRAHDLEVMLQHHLASLGLTAFEPSLEEYPEAVVSVLGALRLVGLGRHRAPTAPPHRTLLPLGPLEPSEVEALLATRRDAGRAYVTLETFCELAARAVAALAYRDVFRVAASAEPHRRHPRHRGRRGVATVATARQEDLLIHAGMSRGLLTAGELRVAAEAAPLTAASVTQLFFTRALHEVPRDDEDASRPRFDFTRL